jgi:hypothetical protein
MKLQIKPYPWSCMVTAYAMAVGDTVRHMMDIIGHDGSEIIFPELEDPQCRRGHHVQECIRAAMHLGCYSTPIELLPAIASRGCAQVFQLPDCMELFDNKIRTSRGVLECTGRRFDHAVAFGYGTIYDPDGHSFSYSREICEARNLYPYKLWIIR